MTSGASAAAATAALESLGSWAFRAGWQAGVLFGAVAVILWLFGRRLSPAWRFALWALVLVRLTVPAVVEVGWASATQSQTAPNDPSPTATPRDQSPRSQATA